MFRIIGAVMIIFAGSMIGILKSDGLKKREECLGSIISGLNLLETDIGYGKCDLFSALLSIGENHKIDMFKAIAENLSNDGIKVATEKALLQEEFLLEKDKAPIRALSANLGMTDSITQTGAIKRAVSGLLESRKNAQEEYARLGRLYRSCGVLGGILGAIILI
ncbi:MAG: stage III sporulation protein AB [Clostridia bacterium]|nr:stage III sporulation protein AB [Clostridia bacterium]